MVAGTTKSPGIFLDGKALFYTIPSVGLAFTNQVRDEHTRRADAARARSACRARRAATLVVHFFCLRVAAEISHALSRSLSL